MVRTGNSGGNSDRAVSSVIGVILIIAVTVILAAIVGAFALDVNDDQAVAPQMSWETDENVTDSGELTELTIRHGGGQSVRTDEVWLRVDGERVDASTNDADHVTGYQWPASDELTTGDEFVLEFDSGYETGDEIWVVWVPENDDETHVLYKYEFETKTGT